MLLQEFSVSVSSFAFAVWTCYSFGWEELAFYWVLVTRVLTKSATMQEKRFVTFMTPSKSVAWSIWSCVSCHVCAENHFPFLGTFTVCIIRISRLNSSTGRSLTVLHPSQVGGNRQKSYHLLDSFWCNTPKMKVVRSGGVLWNDQSSVQPSVFHRRFLLRTLWCMLIQQAQSPRNESKALKARYLVDGVKPTRTQSWHLCSCSN